MDGVSRLPSQTTYFLIRQRYEGIFRKISFCASTIANPRKLALPPIPQGVYSATADTNCLERFVGVVIPLYPPIEPAPSFPLPPTPGGWWCPPGGCHPSRLQQHHTPPGPGATITPKQATREELIANCAPVAHALIIAKTSNPLCRNGYSRFAILGKMVILLSCGFGCPCPCRKTP